MLNQEANRPHGGPGVALFDVGVPETAVPQPREQSAAHPQTQDAFPRRERTEAEAADPVCSSRAG